MSISRLVFTAAMLLGVSVTAFPQITSIESPVCNTEFARFLVDQQVAESKTVEETDKRIRILTRSADFIWKFDQPAAREYFTDAFKFATARFLEKGFESHTDKGLTMRAPDYRFEVIRAIAPKDAEWAKRLTEQLLKEYEKTAAERDPNNKLREIEEIMRIAHSSVKTNPDLSWYLFRRVMREPLDHHWYFAPFQVYKENKQFADALYIELLRNYANETPRRLLFLSAYPFASERIFGVDKYQFGSNVPEDLTPNPGLQRQFIETFLRRVSTYTSDPENINRPPDQNRQPEPVYMISAIQELEPIIVERLPALIQKLSEAKAQINGMLSDEMRKILRDREKRNEALSLGFDERLELVEKADEEGKLTDAMIVNLITWGVKAEDQFKRIEPWLDKIRDEKVRFESTNYFFFLRSKLAIKEKRFSEAQRFAAKVPEIEHRSILSFEIADTLLKNVNDSASVYSELTDVGKLARQTENSVAKAKVLLGLANIYEKVNHVFALDELSDAIKVINRLENPDMLSKSMYRQIQGKGFAFYAVFPTPNYDLESTFTELSKNDFEMSLSNAKSLEDKFFRTLAVLAVAKNCVNKPKPVKKSVKIPKSGGQ
ncbi:MAG: hypothetical protein WKF92_00765 [Pyrinomonadaceae bacterium]